MKGLLTNIFKDYYSDFQQWANELKIYTHISLVKEKLPKYVYVDWENPEKMGEGLLYPILKIKGHRKTKSIDFLGFVNDLYAGNIFRK